MLIDKDPAQGHLCLAGRLSFPFLAAGLILAVPARAGMVQGTVCNQRNLGAHRGMYVYLKCVRCHGRLEPNK